MNFFLIILVVILGRANSSLLSYSTMNPDESQMMSNALRLVNNNFKIYEFDGTTSGILNSLVLSWPSLLNFDITFFSTRLTAIVLVSSILYFTFKIIRHEIDLSKSIVLISPLVLFFALTKDPDYLHYSSELVSCFLLVSSYWVFTKNYIKSQNYTCVVVPFLLGLVLFAKIQFFPVALTLFLFFLLNIFLSKSSIIKIFIACIAFILPSVLILAPYLIYNTINDYFINYFKFSMDFISKSQEVSWVTNLESGGENNAQNSSFRGSFFNHLLFNSLFHLIYLYFLSLIIILITYREKLALSFFLNFKLILSTLIILSVIIVILIPGQTHRHYLIGLVPFLPIFLSSIIKQVNIDYNIKKIRKLKIINITFLFIFLISLLCEPLKFYGKRFEYVEFEKNNISVKSPEIFKFLEIKKDQNKEMYIWGWMPQWHILSNFVPASRETISHKQIEFNSKNNYFRNRLMNDLRKSQPNLIIDFVKPKSFRYNNLNLGIKSFENLNSFVSENYINLKKNRTSCPDYYLKKNAYLDLTKILINFLIEDNIDSKRFNKLDDLSITEDICDDYVIFNNKDKDNIKIKLNKSEKVKKLMILASRKNSRKIKSEVSFFNQGKEIEKKKIYIKKYPFWTTYDLDIPLKVDKILIDIKSLKKNNYGLNEIKIYR